MLYKMSSPHTAAFAANRAAVFWTGLSLTYKFVVLASAGVIVAAILSASMVAGYIEKAMADRSAADAALYMDSLVEPRVQELASSVKLSDENREALERLLSPVAIGRPVVGFRIWVEDRLVFGNERALIGNSFIGTAARRHAAQGHVTAELDGPDSEDDAQIRALRLPILDIYAPVRQTGTGRIIAVAETYELAVELKREIRIAQGLVWTGFGVAALAILWTLLNLAGRSDKESYRLRKENEKILTRISQASRHISEVNERHMWRIGNDLNDGPIQLLGLALLKFESLHKIVANVGDATQSQTRDLETIRHALNETLREIRSLSASLLPSKIESLMLSDAIRVAVSAFELRTGVRVDCDLEPLPMLVPFSIKACLYRYVEGMLESSRGFLGADRHQVRAKGEGRRYAISILWRATTEQHALHEFEQHFANARVRLEELGGGLELTSVAEGIVATASFQLMDAEMVND